MGTRYVINSDILKEIADAIRSKTNNTNLIAVKDFPENISGITANNFLNFTVKQYASEEELLADVCTENTIGIVTNKQIPQWIFSAQEPESTAYGTIWIQTGTDSEYAFNALKDQTLQVYPLSAMQCISGKWKYVPAYAVKNGEWNFWWNGQLIVDGNDLSNITGGWQAVADAHGTGMNAYAPTITWYPGSVSMKLSGYNRRGHVTTYNAVDLTKFSKAAITVEYAVIKSSTSKVIFEMLDTEGNSVCDTQVESTGVCELDISSLIGAHYLRLTMVSSMYGSVTLEISNIVLS